MYKIISWSLAITIVALLSSSALAQPTFGYGFNYSSPVAGQDFYSVDSAGDVNGDGIPDFVIGTYYENNYTGAVYVHSGLDGSLLQNLVGSASGTWFGYSVSGAGDVDGDGFDDFVVGAHKESDSLSLQGVARVYSGNDGTVIHTFYGWGANHSFGFSVSGAGDVNSDGYDDVIIGATNVSNSMGAARVFSGSSGSVLFSFTGSSFNDAFGRSVSGAGDVNGDGFDDVVVGATQPSTGTGYARVYSGADGIVLHTFSGDSFDDWFGNSVACAGDVNDDGFDDLIVGAPLDDDFGQSSGRARVYSGLDGATIHDLAGNSVEDWFGWSVDGAGDVNGDGFGDFIIGAIGEDINGANSGCARLFSGIDGTLLYTVNGNVPNRYQGRSVCGARDVNSDGFADAMLGGTGRAVVYYSPRLPVLKFRTSSNAPHFLDIHWVPLNNNPLALTGTVICTGASPGAFGLVARSLSPADQLYFGFLPVLLDDHPTALIDQGNFGFDIGGAVTAPGISRQNPALAGMDVYVQLFEVSPLVTSSPALRFEVVP